MAVTVSCPNPACGRTFNVGENFLGRTARCQQCGQMFTLKASSDAIRPQTAGDTARSAQTTAPPQPGAPGNGPAAAAPSPTPATAGLPTHLGRFVVRQRLGAGAFGTVYRAYDPQLDREIALKVPQAGVLDSPKRVERFLREARAAAQLRHPHIVPIYDAGRDGPQYYIASAFIQGKPLADAIDEKGIDFRRAATIVGELAEALAYAHALGIVHRDIKPANIMLDADDKPHLMDFGLAARQDTTEKLTHEGAILGTPAYMAPEQARGQQGEAQPVSDQYSVGVVLYELLTGRTPFEGPPQIVLFNAINTEPPKPSSIRKDIPRDLETICLKAMSKRAEDRYPDCQALADDLRRWQEGEAITARRPSFRERLVRWCKREPKLALTGGVAGLALIAVAVLLAVLANQYYAWAEDEIAEKTKEQQAHQLTKAELAGEKEGHKQTRKDLNLKQVVLAQVKIDGDDLTGALNALNACAPEYRGWEWYYLLLRAERAEEAMRLLPGHNGGVAALAFSGDSQRLGCVVQQDGSVKIWDLSTGKTVRTIKLKGAVGWAEHTALSADGKRLAICPRPEFDGPPPFHPFLAAGCAGLLGTPQEFGPLLTASTLSVGGSRPHLFPPLPLAAKPNQLTVWDAQTGEQVNTFSAPAGHLVRLALNADGQRLAGAIGDWGKPAVLKVWDTQTGKEVLTFEGHFENLRSLVFSPDGQRLGTVSGAWEKPAEAKVWDAQNGKEVLTLDAGGQGLQGLVYCPDGKLLAGFTGGGGTHTKYVEEVHTVKVPQQVSRTLPDGKVITETVWREEQRKIVRPITVSEGGDEARVWVWDAQTGKEVITLKGLPGTISAVAFSPDCHLFATAGRDPCVQGSAARLWDLRSGQALLALKTPADGDILHLAFSPDGLRLAAGSNHGDTVTVWSAHPGRLAHNYDGQGGSVCSVAFSPDGKLLTSHSACNQTARVWEANTGKETHTVRNTAIPLSFSQDGTRLSGGCYGAGGGGYGWMGGGCYGALGGCYGMLGSGCYGMVGGCDGNAGCYGAYGAYGGYGWSPGLKVWDRTTARQVPFPKDVGKVVALSPDGQRFASIATPLVGKGPVPEGKVVDGKDGNAKHDPPEVKVWDAHGEKELCTLKGLHEGACVAFSPDGNLLSSLTVEHVPQERDVEVMTEVVKDGKKELVRTKQKVTEMAPRQVVKMWDAQTGKVLLTHAGASGVLAFSPDGSLFASANFIPPPREKVLGSPKMIEGKPPEKLPDPDKEVRLRDFLADLVLLQPPVGQPIMQPKEGPPAGQPKPVLPETFGSVWDTRTGKVVYALKGFRGSLCLLRFSPDGKTLAGFSSGRPPVELEETVTKEKVEGGKKVPYQVCVKRLVSFPALLKVWDARTGKELLTHIDASGVLAFSPDGSRLASAQGSPPRKGMMTPPMDAYTDRPVDGTQFVSTDEEPPLLGQKELPPPVEIPPPTPLPGPPMTMYPGSPPQVKVWDLGTGKELYTLKGYLGAISSLAFSPDSKRLASADFAPHGPYYGGYGSDRLGLARIKVWEVHDGKELLTFAGHTGRVNCLAFSPDSRRLASASDDASVKVWHVAPPGGAEREP